MAYKRGSVADRMAFFRQALEEEKSMNSRTSRSSRTRTRPASADVSTMFSSWRPASNDITNNNTISSFSHSKTYNKPSWQRPTSSVSTPKEEEEQKVEKSNADVTDGVVKTEKTNENGKEIVVESKVTVKKTEKVVSQRKE